MTDVTQTADWKYHANLDKAMLTPLPLQVTVNRKKDGFKCVAYVKNVVERLAKEIAPEITFETTGTGDEYSVHMNFGLPWVDRKAFLEELLSKPDTYKCADQFLTLVGQAEREFVINIGEIA